MKEKSKNSKQKSIGTKKSSVAPRQLLSERNSQKIAIIHDAFLYRGGGERLVSLMARSLGADLISGFFSDGSFDPRELGFTGKMISLGRPVFMKGVRHMLLKWRFLMGASVLGEYDVVIFSGDCLGALRHVKMGAKKIYYCHTPPRYLYDFRERYLARFPWGVRQVMGYVFSYFARVYERRLSEFDRIYTNSQNVHDRLLTYCGHESEILYPPTDTSRFAPSFCHSDEGRICPDFDHKISRSSPLSCVAPISSDARIREYGSLWSHIVPQDDKTPSADYFLSFARLSPPKRVELIVDAFLEMPEQHLILTYGKNDPLKSRILEKIERAENIHAIESPSDDELIALIGGALATIYIPVDEDFGMSPVESMACGTPVIGAREGGLLETIIDGETGVLIDIPSHEVGIIHLKSAITDRTSDDWRAMQVKSLTRAQDFSLTAFEARLHSLF